MADKQENKASQILDRELPPLTTCLSPYVHKLVTQLTYNDNRDVDVVDDDGLIDFDYICSKLPEYTEDSSEYFTACVEVLAPMLMSIGDKFQGDDKQHRIQKWQPCLDWTGEQGKVLLEVWEPLLSCDSPDPVNWLMSLLVTTPVLERSLGDVYLLIGSVPCPCKLKDLLVTSELQKILGDNVIKVLRIMIGPPTSLNLRNLVWHGFPFPAEIPSQCIWFIILMVPSIGKILSTKSTLEIEHREPVIYPVVKPISEARLLYCDDVIEWVGRSRMVTWDSAEFWKKIVHHYSNQRYGVCCSLLLYYLEQCMRRIFATVNNCQHRVLTAQATELFTTFDEMLSGCLPDGSINQLRSTLGDNVMEILLDHLSYLNGPRVRDKLSHGEVSWQLFPWQLTDNIATIIVYIATLFEENDNTAVLEVKESVDNYQGQFHRINILKTKISNHMAQITEVDACITVNPDLTNRSSDKITEDCRGLETDLQQLLKPVIQQLHCHIDPAQICYSCIAEQRRYVTDVLFRPIPTLYRKSARDGELDLEKEVLSILHHIIDESQAVIINIITFAKLRQQQLENKELRSRQRDNFKKFLTSVPEFVLSSCLCCYLCLWQLYHLDPLLSLPGVQAKQHSRFWKSVLQFCENIRSASSLDRNKWTEGKALIEQLVKYLQTHLHKQLTQYIDHTMAPV